MFIINILELDCNELYCFIGLLVLFLVNNVIFLFVLEIFVIFEILIILVLLLVLINIIELLEFIIVNVDNLL